MAVYFDVEGTKFEVEDLTLGECEAIERELDVDWDAINPVGSAHHARVVLSYFLARSKGMDDARRVIEAMTLREFEQSISVVDADKDADEFPKDGATDSTNPSA